MLKKYYLLLAIILVLIGLIFSRQGKIKNPWVKKNNLIQFSSEKVNKVMILSQNKKTIFEKRKDKWLVSSQKDFPAKNQELNEFLDKLKTLTSLEIVSVNPKKNEMFEVTSDKGISVWLYEGKNKVGEIIFGKTGSSGGCYLKIDNKREVFYSPEDLKSFLSMDDFRDLTVIKTNSEKIDKLIFKKIDSGFTLEKKPLKDKKEEKEWYLDGSKIDQSKIADFLITISLIVGKDGFTDKKVDETGLKEPQFSLVISENGKLKTLQVGKMIKEEENPDYYVNIKDSSLVYSITSSIFKDLQKNESDFQL